MHSLDLYNSGQRPIANSHYVRLMGMIFALAVQAPTFTWGATANWTSPNLDVWFFSNAGNPGTRAFGPTFAGDLELGFPHTASAPARLGMSLLAFNTSSQIPVGLPAARYQINSATVTLTMANASGGTMRYDNTLDLAGEILGTIVGDSGRPMELYGVGFRHGYTGYEFGSPVFGPPRVDEVTHPYFSPDSGYVAYPIVGNSAQSSKYRDVSNNITGGFSATESDAFTEPFSAVPWSIGKANLPVGASIPNNTRFTFQLDLAQAGARQYLQQSVANGALGFFISSLHDALSGAYPQWYLRESAGGIINGIPATFAVNYEILPEPQPTPVQKVYLAFGETVPVDFIGIPNTPFVRATPFGLGSQIPDVAFDTFRVRDLIEDIFVGSGIDNIEFLVSPPLQGDYTTVYFSEESAGSAKGIAYTGIDRLNRDRSGAAVIFSRIAREFAAHELGHDADPELAIAEITAHEIGHLLGLRHVDPFPPLEVMDRSLTPEGYLPFFSAAPTALVDPVDNDGLHNPRYHLKRWVDGVPDSVLRADGIHPGQWDIPTGRLDSALLDVILDDFSETLFNVEVLVQIESFDGTVFQRIIELESATTTELSQLHVLMPASQSAVIIASSEKNGPIDTFITGISDPQMNDELGFTIEHDGQLQLIRVQAEGGEPILLATGRTVVQFVPEPTATCIAAVLMSIFFLVRKRIIHQPARKSV